MIVDPDFFDHWRTRMVADMLQDPLAPVYIMRLWAHCQNRKSDVFDIPAAGLKALCRFPGAAQELEVVIEGQAQGPASAVMRRAIVRGLS